MKDAGHRKRMVGLATASVCALTVGYATLSPERGPLPTPQLKLSDASSFLNLFPPVKEPASNPGGSR